MIKNLSLTNFKAWSTLPRIRLAPLTGLFGVNSAGKSSLIQFLLMLKQTTISADRQQVVYLSGSNNIVDLGSYADIVSGHDITKEISWDFQFDVRPPLPPNEAVSESISELEFSVTIGEHSDSSRTLFLQESKYVGAGQEFILQKSGKGKPYQLIANGSAFAFEKRQGQPFRRDISFKCYSIPTEIRGNYKNADFVQDFELAVENLFRNVYYLGPLRDSPRREYNWGGGSPEDVGVRGERVIEALLAARGKGEYINMGRGGRGARKQGLEEYVAYWLRELKLIESFELEELAPNSNLYRVLVQRNAGGPKVALTDVGFGVSQVLPVITLCYYVPEGSTVIFEHPEIHLHPSAQSGLANVLLDAIKRRKIQVILESHSEHLLQRIQLQIAEEKVDPNDCALYFSETVDGTAHLRNLEIDTFGNIRNWPENFFGDQFGEMAAMTSAVLERKKSNLK